MIQARGEKGTPTNDRLTPHDALNAVLADSFALYMKTKSFHWHVSGPSFRDYHLLFDEQATQIFASIDPLAERVRKTGGSTLRSIGEVARLQRIEDEHRVDLPAEEMLTILRDDNQSLIGSLQRLKRIADDAGDNGTSGLVDTLTDSTEERVWFLTECLTRR